MTSYEFTLRISGSVVREILAGDDRPADPNQDIPMEALVQAGGVLANAFKDTAAVYEDDAARVVTVRGPFLSRGGERGSQQSSLLTALQRAEVLQRELSECERSQNEFVNELLKDAPLCWDGDEAAESLALDYLRHLEAATAEGNISDGKTRHRETCDGGC